MKPSTTTESTTSSNSVPVAWSSALPSGGAGAVPEGRVERFVAATVYPSGSWEEHGVCAMRMEQGRWVPVDPAAFARLEAAAARRPDGRPTLLPESALDRLPEVPHSTEIL